MFIFLTGIFEEITLMGHIHVHACKSELFIMEKKINLAISFILIY